MTDVDVLIIGGGPTGLGAAWQLTRHEGVEWLLYEQNSTLGGLSRSIVDDAGYTWDIGGHVAFSHYEMFDAVVSAALGADGCFTHDREAWIRSESTWIPYPFQNNLHRLPASVRERCIAGLIAAAEAAASDPVTPCNFDEFIDATFGRGIAEAFMRPYNEKVWAHPLSLMSYGWIGERVSVPDPVRVARNAASGQDDVSWGPNSRFLFPRTGGTGAIWSGIGSLLPSERVQLGVRAVSIDRASRRVAFADGSSVGYRHLITTAPLDVTARMLEDSALTNLTAGLRRTSVHVVGLGVEAEVGARLGTKCWTYFPDPQVPFYRVTNFSHYSPAHLPVGVEGASLLVEVSASPYRIIDEQTLVAEVVRGLISAGLLDEADQVRHSWTYRAEYGYPVPTLERDTIVDPTLVGLEAEGILSRGRFGAWRYEVGNMDHSFMQGYEAAAHALTGSEELTLWHPEVVNAPRAPMGRDRLK